MVALGLGAVDVMVKPHGSHSIGLDRYGEELIAKVVAAAGVNVGCLEVAPLPKPRSQIFVHSNISTKFPIVIIASSTGGPRALRALVPDLTDAEGVAYVIVQHLPEGFSASMANDLDQLTGLNVYEAEDGDELHSGDVLVVKSGYHLVFDRRGRASLNQEPPVWGVRPSADVTMISAAQAFGSRLVGVVMTGMGSDGTAGLKAIKEAGGKTVAEHESSCVVYGMPRVAIESGVVDTIAPLRQIANAINEAICRRSYDI